MFSASELADLRAEQSAALDTTCVVTTPGAEVDTVDGGTTPGTATTATVACRTGPLTANEQTIADRLGRTVDAAVTLPYGTAVEPKGGTIAVGGKTFDVVYDNSEQSYAAAVRVLVSAVR